MCIYVTILVYYKHKLACFVIQFIITNLTCIYSICPILQPHEIYLKSAGSNDLTEMSRKNMQQFWKLYLLILTPFGWVYLRNIKRRRKYASLPQTLNTIKSNESFHRIRMKDKNLYNFHIHSTPMPRLYIIHCTCM